jgi:hypothetical protein
MQSTAAVFNPYKNSTLEGNWYEERFFHANTRGDEGARRMRPLTDEIENIPRVTRICQPTGEIFQPDAVDPSEQYQTMSRAAFVRHRSHEESVTERRMSTSPEKLQEILAAAPQRFIPDHRLPPLAPEKRFKSEYRKSYVRHI